MASGSSVGPAFGGPRSLPDSARLLEQIQAEVLEHIEAQRAGALTPDAPAFASGGWLAAALLTWLTVAALVVFRPGFVSAPVGQPWSSPLARREASLRYGVWLADGAVRRFLTTNKRLPSFLGEAGVGDPTIQLIVTGERSYELVGSEGAVGIKLTSSGSADAFLGESLSELRRP